MGFLTGQVVTGAQLNRLMPLKVVRITSAGSPIATTSGTTELDLAKYQMTGLSLTTGRYYLYRALVTFTKTADTDPFEMRLRANTAVSGTQLGAWAMGTAAINPPQREYSFIFIGDASHTSLFLSLVRTGGAGTGSYFGTTGGFNRAWAGLWDLNDNSVDVA